MRLPPELFRRIQTGLASVNHTLHDEVFRQGSGSYEKVLDEVLYIYNIVMHIPAVQKDQNVHISTTLLYT